MRTFLLIEQLDTTTTKVVAEGVEFSSGVVVLSWVEKDTQLTTYDDITKMMRVQFRSKRRYITWNGAKVLKRSS